MNQPAPRMPEDRLNGLIAYVEAHHGVGFINRTLTKDELLALLQEVKGYRRAEAQSLSRQLVHP